MNLLREYIRTLLTEAAKGPQDLPDSVHVVIDSPRGAVSAKIFYAENSFGDLVSSVVFSWDSKRAYYLFGANKPMKDENYIGTVILWEAFKSLRELDVKEIDLEGINSPERGWFKLSFGGNIDPYYLLTYSK